MDVVIVKRLMLRQKDRQIAIRYKVISGFYKDFKL